jgi:nucleotide-binding universal stress UspA family protein
MKNILIPTDFSENSWNAIEYAIQFFKKSACNFYLLHVNADGALKTDDSYYVQYENVGVSTLNKPSKELLKEMVGRISECFAKNTNHRFFTLSDSNNLIGSIREHVVKNNIDLIVMGTKGASGIKGLAIGGNTGNVITKVKCTTLVVPENAKYVSPKNVVLPTDFSIEYNPDTLQPLFEVLKQHQGKINVLNVSKHTPILNEDQKQNKEFLRDYFMGQKHDFYFLAHKHIDCAVQQFVDFKDISLISVLAKNLNYLQRILFQPSIDKVNYYKNVPFLVLH